VPTSHPYQLNEIVQLIVLTDPRSLIDVGVGFGKYGLLAREYLELWDGREAYGRWRRRMDGIEAFEKYLTAVHDFVYDRIYIGDALEVLPALDQHYDLALLIDVLEHFEHDDGIRLVAQCQRRARNVLISTPKDIGVQKDAFQNPYETHRFQWRRHHLEHLGPMFTIANPKSLNLFLGADAPRIRKAFRRSRLKAIANAHAPALAGAYRATFARLRR
jgi:hypothetical protein